MNDGVSGRLSCSIFKSSHFNLVLFGVGVFFWDTC